jgi:peptidyl-tRNA hydrolase
VRAVEEVRHHYVIVRADLPRGMQAAQLVHAAGESSPGDLAEGTHAVVLTARNEAELVELERRLDLAGVAHVAIREPDAPYNGQLMAIGCVPARKEVLRRHLSSLPLLR